MRALFDAGPAVSNGWGIAGLSWADCHAFAATGEISPQDVRALFHMSRAYAAGMTDRHPMAMSPADLAEG